MKRWKMLGGKRWQLVAIFMSLMLGNECAQNGAAADTAADQDTTPVADCSRLPPSVSLQVMSWSETEKVCNEMVRVFEGTRRKDITNFEKAIYILRAKGYAGDNVQIAKDLVEVIRLRGLYDKPDRWYDTNDVIAKSWNAFNGIIGPKQVISFLRGAGPKTAKGLSDDGLTNMIVLMKIQHQQGDD
jgi:hypothetical protein